MPRKAILISSLLAVLAVPSAASAALSYTPAPGSPYATADQPDGVALADFNHDGRQDALVGSRNGNQEIQLLLGKPDGSLAQAVPFKVGHNLPVAVAAADLNKDGNPDAISAAAVGNNARIAVLLGDGKGGLAPAAGSPYAMGAVGGPNSGHGLGVADFDGDGNLDIVAATSDENVALLRGTGTGALGAPTLTDVTGQNANAAASSVVVGDFAGDGRPDVFTGDATPPRVNTTLRNDNGVLTLVQSKTAGGDRPSAGDLDGKGKTDVALTDTGPDEAVVFGLDAGGAATAMPGSPFDVDLLFANGTDLTDLDADGKLDLSVAAQDGVDVWRGNGAGGFTQFGFAPLNFGEFNQRVTAGDVDGDGQPDLVFTDASSDRVRVQINQNVGNGSASDPGSYGYVALGGSADRTVTLTSTGTGFLRVDKATIAGFHPAAYSIATDGCTGRSLPVGQTCDIVVRFAPEIATVRQGELEIATNAGTRSASLIGAGTAPPPGPGPGPGPGTGPAKDLVRPVLSRLRLSTSKFAVKGKRRGTRISYTLSEAATVSILIERATSGRVKGKSCVAQTRALKRAKKCVRYVRVGTLVAKSKKGTTKLTFTGRLSKKLLARGGYRLTATATDAAGNRTKAASTKRFTIVKP